MPKEQKGVEDSFIRQIDARVQALKQSSGLEAEYMLFGELLDDERQDGLKEGLAKGETKGRQDAVALIAAMIKDGKSDLLPKLEEPEFLEKMIKKYL